jgi:hypothetical protein
MMFAQMGMLQAINRHKLAEFDPKQLGKTQAQEGRMKS